MSLFIVRPKRRLSQSLALAGRSFEPTRRSAQVQEALDLRKSDPVEQEVIRRLKSMKGVKLLTTSESDTPVTGTMVVDMSDDLPAEEQAARLREGVPESLVLSDSPIELIQPVQTRGAKKQAVTARDLWHLKSIGLEAARKRGFKGSGDGVTVAVLDTGIDPSHAELADRLQGAYVFDPTTWRSSEQKPSQDTNGHGTHVAGLLCGKKVGVAPGAKLLSGVMLPHGVGRVAQFILAFEWAAMRPEVSIVNISAGHRYMSPDVLQTYIDDLLGVGVLPVVAVGNEGRNSTRCPGNCTGVVSVGAITRLRGVWSSSSSGTINAGHHQYNVPNLVAPGHEVYSSVMGGGYDAWSGTSMATPIVSGVAALILQRYPKITVADLLEELLAGCKVLEGDFARQGKGLIQVKAAL